MLSVIVGAVLGAAAMYFFDRNSGAGRREDVKDRASGTAHQLKTQVDHLGAKVRKTPDATDEPEAVPYSGRVDEPGV